MLDKLQDEIYFHTFLKLRRETLGITLREIAHGVCSASTVLRMEQDETVPEKMIRNRIVARLGISGEKYEDYLPPREYDRWLLRQDILKHIERKQFTIAEELLNKYAKIASKKAIERQFVTAMKFMLLQMQNAPLAEQRTLIEEAVKQTISMKNNNFPKNLKDLLLADQEINLLIEYVALHGTGMNEKDIVDWRLEKYREIIEYIDNSYIDNLGRAKIYPKVVYYWMKLSYDYYKNHSLEMPREIVEYGLEVCNKAVELLRDTAKLFYFMELLELRKLFCSKKLKYVTEEIKELKELIETTTSWYQVLMGLYQEYEISPYMEHFGHLYWEMQSYPMGETIRIRRKMKGMTKEELSDETCDLKSITRCEKDRVKTQKYTIRGVFPKVGLGLENICGTVVTNDAEVLELYDKMIYYANSGDLIKWEEYLNKLVACLDMNIPENKQVVEMAYNLLLWKKRSISNEEFQVKVIKNLSNTILIEQIINNKSRYVTQKELLCLYNIAIKKFGNEKLEYLEIAKEILEKYEYQDKVTPHIAEYECIMSGVSSEWGNIGRYEESSFIAQKVIKEELKHRRIGFVVYNIYGILWNLKQENYIAIDNEIMILQKCILLSTLIRNEEWIIFLKKKLKTTL